MRAVSILICSILAVGFFLFRFFFFFFHIITQPEHVIFQGYTLFFSVQLHRINATDASASSIGNVLFLCLQTKSIAEAFHSVPLPWTEGKAAEPGDNDC